MNLDDIWTKSMTWMTLKSLRIMMIGTMPSMEVELVADSDVLMTSQNLEEVDNLL